MVSLAIMGIVMAGAYQLFIEGMQLFRVNQAATDAQLGVTKASAILTTELANASPELTRHYGPPYTPPGGGAGGGGAGAGASEPPGLVFATPLTKEGKVRYDEINGRLYWQRYIAYYFSPDPQPGGYNGKIYRTETDVAGEPGDSGGTGNRDINNVVIPFLNGHSTTYFSGLPQPRTIADGISGLYVQPYDANPEFGITAVKEAYDIYIEAGDAQKAFRNSYFIRVRVRVSPGAR